MHVSKRMFWRGNIRKEGQKVSPLPANTDVLIGLLRSWKWDARNMIKGGRMCGTAEELRIISYALTIGKQGTAKG